MIENLIVGAGFSALCSYMILKNSNTRVLNFKKINSNPNFLIDRKNLNNNKFFSNKSISLGTINYTLESKIKFHDRLISGGNTNLWGGFIKDISSCPIRPSSPA